MLVRLLLLLAIVIQGARPVIDGNLSEGEWAAAKQEPLVGGGTVSILRRGGDLFIAVRGTRAGLASLCVAKGDTIRILHASAASGEARFNRGATGWTLGPTFEWLLRDSPRTGGVTAEQYAAMTQKVGWTANPSAAGSPIREFQIRAADVDAIAVTFLATDDPMALSHWPAGVTDDCRNNLKIAQGYLPPSAAFDPSKWYQVR
jgi:hypothetical protein